MDELSNRDQAVELLQQLGLKEYEAKSFVALARLPRGTAKEISEVSEVPRTRVYDAVRVLETKGLVEIQHSNPQQFRAVSIDEAVETLRHEYESRADSLRETLRGIEPADSDGGIEVTHEVWALSGQTAVTNRAQQLIDGADQEVVLVVGHELILTDELVDHLQAALRRDVDVIVGTNVDGLRGRVEDALPGATVFVSGLDWLTGTAITGDDTEISRLLLADRSAILVSTFHDTADGTQVNEQAVFGEGFDNGLVAIVRRLMATGLLAADDPRTDDA
ncbi:MAG TPA: helix-turn-helix domain-containing protein [Halobacteriales archaeon]|nr:helix-turn-helix domain-containing protein [Halobacteriales archaeon]